MMPITDRDIVEDGDIVLIDFVGKVDGVEFEGGSETDYELEIGSGMFIDDFEAQLIGKKVGEKATLEVTFPEDYSQTELAGKDAEFYVTVKQIGVREFTDAFVTFNTEYETAEEYKDYLYDGLVESKEYDAQSQIEESILTSIIDNSTFYDISEDEIEAKKDEILSTYESYADYYGVSLEEYVDSIFSMTMDEFYDEVDYLADLYVKESYVLAEVAKQEQISLSDEEYASRLQEVKDKYQYDTVEEIETEYGGKEGLTKVFIEQMVLEFLKESAVFN
jgi:trigger factor